MDEPRDIAAIYFKPLAGALEERKELPFSAPWRELSQRLPRSLERMLERAALSCWQNKGPGGGAWGPRQILIVCEAPHESHHSLVKFRLPYFSLHGNGASSWLADQLELAGVGEGELYWCHAFDSKGGATASWFVQDMKPKAIIAIGERADLWCARANFAAYRVPRPNDWMKYEGANEPYPLIEILERIKNEK